MEELKPQKELLIATKKFTCKCGQSILKGEFFVVMDNMDVCISCGLPAKQTRRLITLKDYIMRKTIMLILFLVSSYQCFAPNGEKYFGIEESEPVFPFNLKDPILRAVAHRETNFNPDTINTKENAGGLLQIRSTMINEVNRICIKLSLPDRFILADRLSPEKSIKIWYIVQAYHNPGYALKEACMIWNGRGKGKDQYYSDVNNFVNKVITKERNNEKEN